MPDELSAADLVTIQTALRHPAARGMFLREIIGNALASIVMIEGEQAGCECAYRFADAMVGCSYPEPPEYFGY